MHQTHLEILVDSVHKNKENVGAVGDVDVRRRFAQFDARHSGSLSQRPAVSVMLRQNSLQLVNKLLLHSTNRQNTHFLSRLSVYQVQSSTITYTFWVGSPYVCLRKLITTFFLLNQHVFPEITQKVSQDCWHELYTGWIPNLSLNQKHQSMERILWSYENLLNVTAKFVQYSK